MNNKSAILGLLSKNDENINKALDTIIEQYENKILEKIYKNEGDFEFDLQTREYYVISKDDLTEIQKNLITYNKFEKSQNGRKRLEIDITEIQEFKSIGLSNRQIANKLNVSEGTIRNHLKRKNTIINFKKAMQNERK